MTRDFLLFLSDIVDNMKQAEQFIGPTMTFDQFAVDRKTA